MARADESKQRHYLVDRDGRVLAEIKLTEGVTQPEMGRALVSGRPLQIMLEAEPLAKAGKADAEAKAKADAEAKKKGGGSK
tara:strand:+ start:2343 stop:2585 length:243 start_codon:yes stop_codon:yes gene_type:complete